MLEIGPDNAVAYLRERGWLPDRCVAHCSALSWGVSNCVLRVAVEGAADLVLKQSRAQLRTKAAWFSRLDRIFREIDILRLLAEILPPHAVPRVLFEDRENYLFGMEAAPVGHVVWKQQLLAGACDPLVARQLGAWLGQVHARTARREDLAATLGDRTVFHELRLHPFYESLAAKFPPFAPALNRLVAEASRISLCLVLADFSPKNVLVTEQSLVLVDFETGHYGDPAFDLGFFLSHLVLKGLRSARLRPDPYFELTEVFLRYYWEELAGAAPDPELTPEAIFPRLWQHIAGCLWARIDGVSPVDYVEEPARQDLVRHLSQELFSAPPASWADWLAHVRRSLP